MNYWDAILYEVKHRNDKSTRFLFTTLGDEQAELEQAKKRKLSSRPPRDYQKIYFMNDKQERIYFTCRERECLVEMLKGQTIAATGVKLGLSPRTVEYYLKNMKLKMCCSTKAELLNKLRAKELLTTLGIVL